MGDEQDKETGETSRQSVPKDIPLSGEGSSAHSPNLGASAMFPSASPPAFVTMEQILKACEDVSHYGFNMALAHEIAVNKDFKLEQNMPKGGWEEKLAAIFHKAFWDLFTEQVTSTPPKYEHAIVLLKEIKETLLFLLLPHNARLKNEINAVLDIDLIEQQAKNQSVDVVSYARFIISTMARICAPARDSNIQELGKLTDLVPLFKGILETLDLMKLDMMNFQISRIRPHLQQHSVEYEQKKFKEILNSLKSLVLPVDGLKFTRLWLQSAYEEAPEPNGPLVLQKAYIRLLTWKEDDKFPETLHLDHERFITLRDNLTVLILTATVILVTYSNVGPSIQDITDFKNTLKSHVQILLADAPHCSASELANKMETVGLQVVKETNECLKSHGFSALSQDHETALVASIKKIAEDDHNVRQLITKRVIEFLELALHSPSNLKVPPGLSSLSSELSSFAGHFLMLVKHNKAVFGEYYDDLLEKIKEHKGRDGEGEVC